MTSSKGVTEVKANKFVQPSKKKQKKVEYLGFKSWFVARPTESLLDFSQVIIDFCWS